MTESHDPKNSLCHWIYSDNLRALLMNYCF